VISVRLFADLRPAGEADDLSGSPDYGRLAAALKAHAESAARLTVEALAEDLAGLCLAEPGVQRARVRVEKPQAVAGVRSVGVEIERGR
jgi:dihydroneopterin aldolase